MMCVEQMKIDVVMGWSIWNTKCVMQHHVEHDKPVRVDVPVFQIHSMVSVEALLIINRFMILIIMGTISQ